MLTLQRIVDDHAQALKAVDESGAAYRDFRPGIGPFSEPEGLRRALAVLKGIYPDAYASADPRSYPGSRKRCDLVIPGQWAIEFKLIRPFGDNGLPAEHWSENVLHPYEGDVSAIGDCVKLMRSGFSESKAVIVYGFEHMPAQVPLEAAVRAFEVVADQVVGIELGPRCVAKFENLVHPAHQQGWIFGWHVLSVPGRA